MISVSPMLLPHPPTPHITFKRRWRRPLLTLAAGAFVAGGLVSLALDNEPVSFAMPEPPPAPQIEREALAQHQPPERADDLDRAFAVVFAELSAR